MNNKCEVDFVERAKFILEYYRRKTSTIVHIKMRPQYRDDVFCDTDAANVRIGSKISNGESFAAARFGANEFGIVASYLKRFGKHGCYSKNQINMFCNNAGFFPAQIDQIDRFAELMLCSAKSIDLLGVWNLFMEDYVVNHYMKETLKVCPLSALEPWSCKELYWSQHLEGKRVLVIHPFAETIKSQYQQREKIFPRTNILPEFELITVKAVQTAAGQVDSRFANWFEALEYMFEQSMRTQFDVAILGCGAYGFPLAAKIKEQGKIAIHLGGPTQLLFGIKGRRWENNPRFSCLFNDAWVRPNVEESPKDANSIEKGCYW